MGKRVVPVSPGDVFDINITGLNQSGEGIGRIDGFALFVPGILPGEAAQVEVTEVKKSYGRGIVKSLVQAAPGRKEVDCSCYEACGGCQLLHLNYEEQLAWKRQMVQETLGRIGGIKATVQPVIGMNDPYHYRNKVQLHVAAGEKPGKASLGYYQAKSRQLIPVTGCYLWAESFHPVMNRLRELLGQVKQSINIKHVVLRQGEGNKVMAVLVTRSRGDNDSLQEVAAKLTGQTLANGVTVTGVYQNINPREDSQVLGREFIHLAGEKQLAVKLGELEFFISPAAFFQVNTEQTKVLYDQVAAYAGLTVRELVLDAYCGTGTIGLYLAEKAKKVVGIEVVADAIVDARLNARHNGIENAEFFAGQVEQLLPKMVKEGFHAQVVVLDPPRAGCDQQVLEAISQMQPERIVYVSCDPATLARDLKILVAEGYEVAEVQPVDMFPHTGHVECVIGMQRKDT